MKLLLHERTILGKRVAEAGTTLEVGKPWLVLTRRGVPYNWMLVVGNDTAKKVNSRGFRVIMVQGYLEGELPNMQLACYGNQDPAGSGARSRVLIGSR